MELEALGRVADMVGSLDPLSSFPFLSELQCVQFKLLISQTPLQ